ELSEDGTMYRSLGSAATAEKMTRVEIVRQILPTSAPGSTIERLLEDWPEEFKKPGKRTLADDLASGADLGRWSMEGRGKKADPYRFWSNGNAFRAPIGK